MQTLSSPRCPICREDYVVGETVRFGAFLEYFDVAAGRPERQQLADCHEACFQAVKNAEEIAA